MTGRIHGEEVEYDEKIEFSKDWVSTMTVSSLDERAKRYSSRKTTVSIWGEPSPKDIYKHYWTPERIEALDDERDLEGSKLWRQFNRDEKEIIKKALDRIEFKGDLELPNDLTKDDIKFRFSRTAGCSCGCSPGWFIINKRNNQKIHLGRMGREVTIFVHLETEAQAKATQERKVKAEIAKRDRKILQLEQEIKDLTQSVEEKKLTLRSLQIQKENANV